LAKKVLFSQLSEEQRNEINDIMKRNLGIEFESDEDFEITIPEDKDAE